MILCPCAAQDSPQTSQVKEGFAAGTDSHSLDHHSRETSSQPLTLSPLLFQNSRSKHASVIQATGLAASSKPLPPLTQTNQNRDNSSRPPTPSLKPLCLALSPKPLSLSSSPKNLTLSSSPKSHALSLSPKPPPLPSTPKPHAVSPSHRPKNLPSPPRPSSPRPPSLLPESLRMASRIAPDKPFLHTDDFAYLKKVPTTPLSFSLFLSPLLLSVSLVHAYVGRTKQTVPQTFILVLFLDTT